MHLLRAVEQKKIAWNFIKIQPMISMRIPEKCSGHSHILHHLTFRAKFSAFWSCVENHRIWNEKEIQNEYCRSARCFFFREVFSHSIDLQWTPNAISYCRLTETVLHASPTNCYFSVAVLKNLPVIASVPVDIFQSREIQVVSAGKLSVPFAVPMQKSGRQFDD